MLGHFSNTTNSLYGSGICAGEKLALTMDTIITWKNIVQTDSLAGSNKIE